MTLSLSSEMSRGFLTPFIGSTRRLLCEGIGSIGYLLKELKTAINTFLRLKRFI